MVQSFDVVFVADPRFPGGTSTALATEMAAADEAGMASALYPVKGPLLRLPRPFHPEIRAALDAGRAVLADTGSALRCTFAIIHHPSLFNHLAAEPVRIEADHVVLVLHHPVTNAWRQSEYDVAAVVRNVRETFGREPLLAPVGPAVRGSIFPSEAAAGQLTPVNWHNLIDARTWPHRKPYPHHGRIVIGRHARPSPLKWPDTLDQALACYPEDPRFQIRILGADDGLVARYGRIPENWELIPFGKADVREFLASLDFYVYFHSSQWLEAFGRAILEAQAAGPVVILPPQFEPLFGEAAVYCQPAEVRARIEAFWSRPDAMAEQSAKARQLVETRFSHASFTDRLEAIAPGWRRNAETPRASHRPPLARDGGAGGTVLVCASNGIGLGHVTRTLAVASRLPPRFTPVFFSLSYATKLIEDEGYLAEYRPFHRASGADVVRWNAAFAEELYAALAFYRPRVFLFDGNRPYSGLCDALAEFPALAKVWIRRPLWPSATSTAIERADAFDAVIEPGELAGRFDRGATAGRDEAYRVGPILYVDPAERLCRKEARRALALADDDVAVALSLGAGNNFNMQGIRAALVEALLALPGVRILEFASPVSDAAPGEPFAPGHEVRRLYPTFRLSAGFDFAVTGAGYNSFHEAVLGAIPTVFVPNEADEMDMQIIRGQYAESVGIGRLLRSRDADRAAGVLADFADPAYRAAITRRCRLHAAGNGAADAALFVADLASMARTDKDFFGLYYR